MSATVAVGTSGGDSGLIVLGMVSVMERSPFVYVGSTSGDILLYALSGAVGELTFVKAVAAGNYPSFLAFDPVLGHAYAVNEPDAMLVSFSINRQSGELTQLNRVASGGAAPAFVAVDRTGAHAMVANYSGGTIRVFPILQGGALGPPTDDQAPGLKSHMVITDPANKFVFVMNLGSDTISQFVFDASTGKLSPNRVPIVNTAKGAGPRHLAFHPNGKLAYVINELDHTLSAYAYDPTLGRLSALQTSSTVPPDNDATGTTCAEVVVAPSGNFVYGSNRGHDSIARFAVDRATGTLELLGTTPSGGNVPRSFTLSADGTLMLVANESGNITSFSVDLGSGALSKLWSVATARKPQFVAIV